MKHGLGKRPAVAALAAALGLLLSGSSFAAEILTTPEPAFISPGGDAVVSIAVVGDGTTSAITGALEYDTTQFDAVAVAAGGVTCAVNDAFSPTVGRVALAVVSLGPLASSTVCTVTFTAIDGAAEASYPLTFANVVFGNSPNPPADVANDGVLTVQLAPPDVVLGFSPAANVVFPGGVSGTQVLADIDVTVASGSVGTGTVDNCVLGGTNPLSFAILSGAATVPPADTIDLQATLANTPISATLTCDLDDASAATQVVFQLSAPAGTPVPAPGYSSTPAPGTALTCNGQPGATTNTSVTIANDGFAGVGSDLTYNCTVSGAAFTITSGAADTLAVGESTSVNVQCTVPEEDAPAAEGELNCTSNDTTTPTADYPISSIAASGPPPIPQPNVVPASSLWSQISLIGLMAALGLLVVGIRRKG